MSGLSLEGIASYVRDLSSACSVVKMIENSLYAGSQDGLLVCWDASSGAERWRVSITGPISDISLDTRALYVTASDSLYAIDESDGSLLWSKQLEGASDYVVSSDGNVWATSSVYELEVADFIEATVWRFDASGNELERWVMAERPWHLASDGSGGVVLGLGRPRCGYLRVQPEKESKHVQLATDSPVTCGSGQGADLLFGHADGTVSRMESAMIENELDSLVTAVASGAAVWISGHDDGSISMRETSQSLSGAIDSVAIVESIGWASAWDGMKVELMIVSEKTMTISHDARLRQMDSSESCLALGDDQGRVFMIEPEVMQRRIVAQEQAPTDDAKNSEIRARLRMFRNR